MHKSPSVSLTRLVEPESRYATVLEIHLTLKSRPLNSLKWPTNNWSEKHKSTQPCFQNKFTQNVFVIAILLAKTFTF